MDKDVLGRRLKERCDPAMAAARAAVEQALDGPWIAGSEGQAREIYQELTRDGYPIASGISCWKRLRA